MQLRKDTERKFKEKLSDWLKREEEKEKERIREKEREKERLKDKQRLFEKELSYDSEEEKKRKMNKYKVQERKRLRQKEIEEDEIERKKEIIMLEEKPPEPELLRPPSPEIEEGETNEKIEKRKNSQEKKRFTFTKIENANMKTENDKMQIESSIDISLGNSKKFKNGNSKPSSNFQLNESEESASLQQKKDKNQEKLEKALQDINKISKKLADDEKMKIENEKKNTMDMKKNDNNEPQNPQQIIVNESIKKELEQLIRKIPTKKGELFNYPINWTLFATSNLLETKVRPWLVNKSIEYIGAEEPTFISMILKRVANKENPHEILSKVEKVLDDDAEDFVMKLWRMIIFELLKAEYNI